MIEAGGMDVCVGSARKLIGTEGESEGYETRGLGGFVAAGVDGSIGVASVSG